MKNTLRVIILSTFLSFLSAQCLCQVKKSSSKITLQIDGSKRLQQIDGIGVNANTRSWNGKELEPALDLLLDTLHATIWRVIVESVEKWEDKNDNDDPF